MQKVIRLVELDHIFPSPTNPRKYFNEARLKELADSIKKVGIIQAITLREKPDDPNNYEIVCGERRYRASKLAQINVIPADIRILTDDEVQELQFIENIEREDVHPMDEAVTFHAMMSNKKRPWFVEDIAAKINKPESYIYQRVQLNQLIESLQKQFWDGKFLIGHALLFSRLTPADQAECAKNVATGGYYGTVKQTQEYIERNIMRQLSAAPFKIDDATLVIKCGAGSCTNCLKRSGGANRLLFEDIKQLDRCFDKACFNEKKEAWIIREVQKILENSPEIILVQSTYSGKHSSQITKLLKQYKVDIYNDNTASIQSYSQTGYKEVKAFYVDGYHAGEYKKMYKKNTAKEMVKKVAVGGVISVEEIDESISAINQRVARGVELDFEKVQEAVVEEINKNYPKEHVFKEPVFSLELIDLFFNFLLFKELDNYQYETLLESIGLREKIDQDFDKVPELLFSKLENLSEAYMNTILKVVLVKNFGQDKSNNPKSHIIRKLANALDIDVDDLIDRQSLQKDKRIKNAAKKVAELMEQREALPVKAKKVAKKANTVDC